MAEIKRAVLVGDIAGHDDFHVGDEAMLEANLELLGRLAPDASLTIVSHDPEYSARAYGVDAVGAVPFSAISGDRVAELAQLDEWVALAVAGTSPVPQAFRVLLTADLLVISGGGNLSSTWPEHILERLALVRLACRCGITIIVLGQTLGPNLTPGDRLLVAEILNAAHWVGLREAPSVALAIELGVSLAKIDYQLDDAVFLPGRPIERLWPRLPNGSRYPYVIAMTLQPFLTADSNDAVLDEFAHELDRMVVATGAHLLFVPHVRVMREGVDSGDRMMGEALARRMAHGESMTVLDVQGARETVWLTQQADMVLSSRYHPLIFGLAAQRPCLALTTDAYTHVKLQGALIHARLGHHVFPISRLSVAGLADKTLAIFVTGAETRTLLRREVVRWQQAERDRETRLSQALHGQMETSVGVAARDGELIRALAMALAGSDGRATWNHKDLVHLLGHWRETAAEAVEYARSLEGARPRPRWWR